MKNVVLGQAEVKGRGGFLFTHTLSLSTDIDSIHSFTLEEERKRRSGILSVLLQRGKFLSWFHLKGHCGT